MSTQDSRHLKKLYATLNAIGFSFRDFEYSKENRIIFQKLVYALQKSGFRFGYNYNLYLNGPYCSSLADDG